MPSDMCSPTWETHIICDMSFPTVAFQLPSLALLLLKIFLTTLGMAFVLSDPNREYNFLRVCPNNKVLPVYV